MEAIEPAATTAASLLARGSLASGQYWPVPGLRALVDEMVPQHADLQDALELARAGPEDAQRVGALAQALAALGEEDLDFGRDLVALVANARQAPGVGGLVTQVYGHAQVGTLVTIGQAGDLHFHLPPAPAVTVLDRLRRGRPGVSVANLPPRNPSFTGREELLDQLHASLHPGQAAAVVQALALHGLGGVGKTQLAVEYAHRHLGDYGLIWWVAAEQPVAVPGQLVALARRLGIPEAAQEAETIRALCDELRQLDRWLLIFDNADDPRDLRPYWPPSNGQILVTSRNPAWASLASTLHVDVLPRGEAILFLRRRLGVDANEVEALAEALGDLPLALEQAAAYVEQTQIQLTEYLERFYARRQRLLDRGAPLTHNGTVNATVQLAADRVANASQAGIELLRLCAFMAPDAIPLDLLAEAPQVLPSALASAARDWGDLDDAVAALVRYSLVDREPAGLHVHRLVQAVVEDTIATDSTERDIWVDRVIRLLGAGWPDSSYYEQSVWPRCAQLLPHVVQAARHAGQVRVALEPTAKLLTEASYYARHLYQFQTAEDFNKQALAIRQATPTEDPNVGRNLANQGNILRGQGRFADARGLFERALEIHQAAFGPQHPEVARYHSYLGSVLRELGDLPAARTELERALEVHQAEPGPEQARDRVYLGLVLHDLGDLTRARAQLEHALAIDQAVQKKEEHQDVARDRTFLGLVLRDLCDLTAAREQCEHALAIDDAIFGSEHPPVARDRANLGLVLLDLGDLGGALAELQRALTIYETHLGPDHPDVATSLDNLGLVLQAQGDLDHARTHHERALAIREARQGPDHPLTATSLHNLATVLRAQGHLDAARSLFERALAVREARLGADHRDTARSRESLAAVVAALDQQQ
jgi:tetratricopeptide (TPR) repeat protein